MYRNPTTPVPFSVNKPNKNISRDVLFFEFQLFEFSNLNLVNFEQRSYFHFIHWSYINNVVLKKYKSTKSFGHIKFNCLYPSVRRAKCEELGPKWTVLAQSGRSWLRVDDS